MQMQYVLSGHWCHLLEGNRRRKYLVGWEVSNVTGAKGAGFDCT